jgi:hypothetical protein
VLPECYYPATVVIVVGRVVGGEVLGGEVDGGVD